MAASWNITPCSLIRVDRRFRGVYILNHQGDRPDDGGLKHRSQIDNEERVYRHNVIKCLLTTNTSVLNSDIQEVMNL
jgi:hypothetical protein